METVYVSNNIFNLFDVIEKWIDDTDIDIYSGDIHIEITKFVDDKWKLIIRL